MTMKKLLGVAAVMVLGGSGVASAQVYGPGPGILTKHLWTIPGVINNGMATAISCTNATANTVTVGVEFFGDAGGAALNNALSTATVLGPGASVMYSSQPLVGFLNEIN
jgi:hypothetical protein